MAMRSPGECARHGVTHRFHHVVCDIRLKGIARAYLGINGSSTVSERVFSKCGFVTEGRRNQLSGEFLEAVLFLNACSRFDWLWVKVKGMGVAHAT